MNESFNYKATLISNTELFSVNADHSGFAVEMPITVKYVMRYFMVASKYELTMAMLVKLFR